MVQSVTLLVSMSLLADPDDDRRPLLSTSVPLLLKLLKFVSDVCSTHYALRIEPCFVSHDFRIARIWSMARYFLSETVSSSSEDGHHSGCGEDGVGSLGVGRCRLGPMPPFLRGWDFTVLPVSCNPTHLNPPPHLRPPPHPPPSFTPLREVGQHTPAAPPLSLCRMCCTPLAAVDAPSYSRTFGFGTLPLHRRSSWR